MWRSIANTFRANCAFEANTHQPASKRIICSGFLLLAFVSSNARAQSPVGTVSVADADVTAPIQIIGGRALLSANTTVTAHDHTAEVDLEDHGLVMVCATTALHIAAPVNKGPLMLSMDRGALELRIKSHPGDVLVTPDLRIQTNTAASLDLQLRVARNGDTCIENRASSPDAATLEVHEQFGDGMYLLHPGQHVLFNYGNLHQVVDNESSPCGCPALPASLQADAAHTSTASKSVEKYPFPLAQSEGLEPTPTPVPPKPGETKVSINATMSMDGDHPPAAQTTTPSTSAINPPAVPPKKSGFFQSIGHFFKKIFGGN